MRLFRQQRSGDWEEVWSRIMSALKGFQSLRPS